MTNSDPGGALRQKIEDRSAKVGVIGMGYVGLPLAVASGKAGFSVTGYDIDPNRVSDVNEGLSHIAAVKSDQLKALKDGGKICATTEFASLKDCDIIVVCVPTPG